MEHFFGGGQRAVDFLYIFFQQTFQFSFVPTWAYCTTSSMLSIASAAIDVWKCNLSPFPYDAGVFDSTTPTATSGAVNASPPSNHGASCSKIVVQTPSPASPSSTNYRCRARHLQLRQGSHHLKIFGGFGMLLISKKVPKPSYVNQGQLVNQCSFIRGARVLWPYPFWTSRFPRNMSQATTTNPHPPLL